MTAFYELATLRAAPWDLAKVEDAIGRHQRLRPRPWLLGPAK